LNNPLKERMNTVVNLSVQSRENMAYMLEEIKKKLQVVNAGAIKSEHLSEDQYEDLKDLYEMVMKKNSFSISEMDGILGELRSMRS
jgi:uncharacterized protein YfkK (UPF0435 family)